MEVSNKSRIIFLDLMRAFAVLMMVQGHTIDAFLGDQYRSPDSPIFNIWYSVRGFTAPIFMFTSGVVFTYLLKLNHKPFIKNPRVAKGFYRFLILVLIGYSLRYPTGRILDFSFVTHDQWMTFFTVDALQLIGFGILFILFLSFLAEKLRMNDYIIFISGALVIFIAFLFTERINWANFLPIPFAAYLYHGTGSYFPLFPWAGYVLSGGILGLYLAKNPLSFSSKSLSKKLFVAGAISFLFCFLLHQTEDLFYGEKTFWTDNSALIFFRLGVILVLNSIMSYIALKLKTIPDIVQQVGKNTLLIYVVHVIIIYGSIWIPGFGMFYPKSLNIPFSILAAILLIVLMFGMVLFINSIKIMRRKKTIAVEF